MSPPKFGPFRCRSENRPARTLAAGVTGQGTKLQNSLKSLNQHSAPHLMQPCLLTHATSAIRTHACKHAANLHQQPMHSVNHQELRKGQQRKISTQNPSKPNTKIKEVSKIQTWNLIAYLKKLGHSKHPQLTAHHPKTNSNCHFTSSSPSSSLALFSFLSSSPVSCSHEANRREGSKLYTREEHCTQCQNIPQVQLPISPSQKPRPSSQQSSRPWGTGTP